MRSRMYFLMAALLISSAPRSFGISASYWTYDGEFASVNSATSDPVKNRPMFMDINEFGEMAYGHLGSGVPASNNEVYIVTNIFADTTDGTAIPVTQTRLDHSLNSDNGSLRGISGVAFQPGTGNLWLSSDAGANKREVQSFTRVGAVSFNANTTMSLANQSRVLGLAFSPVRPSSLVVGELNTSTGAQKSKFNVYDVSAVTTLTLLGSVNVPNLGTGRYVRDVTVDSSEAVYLNVNGSITKMAGSGLGTPADVATYTSATLINDPGADNDINPMGISWSDLTDEPIIVANGGNNPSADPRLHRVWNSETGAPIPQISDPGTSNALSAIASVNGEFGNSCDSKVAAGPDGSIYLFVSEIVKDRIVRFKAVVPPTRASREWELYE